MRVLLCVLFAASAFAQSNPGQSNPCGGTPAWSPCDWSFDLNPSEDPSVFELRIEFRSPTKHKTYLLHAFRDGDRRFTIRFTPTEAGTWDYRLTSNLKRLEAETGTFEASSSDSPGFVKPANVHHFKTENGKPHLWIASPLDGFLTLSGDDFEHAIAQLASDKFTHIRVTLPANADLREAADRIRSINKHGLVADVVLESIPAQGDPRLHYLSDLASRFAALNIIWMGLPAFENIPNTRAILKDTGEILKRYDPYDHPRTSLAAVTSGVLANDPWTSIVTYATPDPNIGAVEHQLYGEPAINTGIRSAADLWNATMNGQYPASGSGEYLAGWIDFMSSTRYWELEPYFDLDGGRGIALPGVEYIIYLEKPGPIEVTLEDHGYDVQWINPANGERVKAKGYRGAHFTGMPPDQSHPWVLHIYREGEMQSRLKSYDFDSRDTPIQLQEVEINSEKTPYEVSAPPQGDLTVSKPPGFTLHILRPSRATRSLLIEWTGEITSNGQGYRVIGTGRDGTLQFPPALAQSAPASMLVRVYVMNANGKVYEIDKVYGLNP